MRDGRTAPGIIAGNQFSRLRDPERGGGAMAMTNSTIGAMGVAGLLSLLSLARVSR